MEIWMRLISHYNNAVEINPAFVAKMYNRTGYYLAEQGQLDLAMSQFEKAIQIFPDYANAHNNLGVVLAKRGTMRKLSHTSLRP